MSTPDLLFILRRLEGIPGSLGNSQKEGQEDQETLKQLGSSPLAVYLSLILVALYPFTLLPYFNTL